jgi:glucan phosphoethanolaminetransferase (alkaline phosphatase superfamily)
MRKVLSFRKKFLWIFKGLEISAFAYLIYYLASFNSSLSFNILLAYILFYGFLVWNNNRVYYKAKGNPSTTFRSIFLLMLVISASFIYLNNALYQDLQTSYESISECSADYRELQNQCSQDVNTTSGENYSETMEDRLENLDLSLPNGGD